MMENPSLQAFLNKLGDSLTPEFKEASDHPHSCRCEKCRMWWKAMGNDEDGYGPFTKEEVDGV